MGDSHNMTNLDLYSKAEHLLGIEEASEALYDVYRGELDDYEVKTLLDVGCGRGNFMERLIADGIECKGIDLSQMMVDACRQKGLDAQCKDIKDETGKYDAIVSIFDVLNFMDKDSLSEFMQAVADRLNDRGVFIADINTLSGFADVAEGSMSNDTGNEFLSVDAVFENNELHTKISLFEKSDDGHFRKYQDTIVQYFHKLNFFQNLKGLKLVDKQTFSLYAEGDKTLLIFKKS